MISNSSSSRLFICRHSERIDEADESLYNEWLQQVDSLIDCKRPKKSIKRDPILTEQGIRFAQILGQSLSRITEIRNVTCIYCSRLHRCVQTAYEIAKILNLPVYVSIGLSQTAKAIETIDIKNSDSFQFLSLQEIRESYSDVIWNCCDESYDKNGEKIIDNVNNNGPQIPWNEWKSALKYLAQNNTTTIIVAHRETIRKLGGKNLKTPYCCYGIFDWYEETATKLSGGSIITKSTTSSNTKPKKGFKLRDTRSREGQKINENIQYHCS